MNRLGLGRMRNPARGFLHGSAAIVSVVGLIALLARSQGYRVTLASAVYGIALIAMYLTSALYHSVPWQPDWRLRLQKLDHTFIYALVAATFTPLVVTVSRGPWVIVGLGGAWALVALGLGRELAPARVRRIILPLQFLAVGVTLAPLWVTLVGMDTPAAVLTVAGGAVYLFGVFLFVNNRPRLAPQVFSHHEFFHVLVIVASVMHYLAVWRVISTF